jgi:hypothetical protein
VKNEGYGVRNGNASKRGLLMVHHKLFVKSLYGEKTKPQVKAYGYKCLRRNPFQSSAVPLMVELKLLGVHQSPEEVFVSDFLVLRVLGDMGQGRLRLLGGGLARIGPLD